MTPLPTRTFHHVALISFGCLVFGLGPNLTRAQSPSSSPGGSTPGATSGSATSANASKHETRFLMKAHASGLRELQLSQLAATRATNPQVKSYAQQLVSAHQQMAQEMKPLLTAAGLDAPLPSGVMGSSTSPGGTPTYGTGSGSSSSAGTSGSGAAGNSATGSAGSYPSGSTAAGTSAGSTSSRDTTANSASGGSASYHGDTAKSGSMRDRWSRMMSDRQQQKLAKKTGADFDEAYVELMVDEHQDAVDLFEDAIEDNVSSGAQGFASKYLPKLQQHLTQAKQLEDAID